MGIDNKVSSLRDFSLMGLLVRKLKHTVNKVSSLRDFDSVRFCSVEKTTPSFGYPPPQEGNAGQRLKSRGTLTVLDSARDCSSVCFSLRVVSRFDNTAQLFYVRCVSSCCLGDWVVLRGVIFFPDILPRRVPDTLRRVRCRTC
jgi:hypothetical protein